MKDIAPQRASRSNDHGRFAALRRRGREESGAYLVITAILLVAILGLTALAVDVGSFYQARDQAQSAADAAALQGADDLAAGDSTSQAQNDAKSLGSENFSNSTVSAAATGTTVTVTVNASTPTYFGRIFGMTSANVSARAVAAAGASTSTACTPVAGTGNCWAIFAMGTSCSSPTAVGFSGGGYTVDGGIHSNGGLNTGGGGSKYGPTTYNSSCTPSTGGGDTFVSGPSGGSTINTWPIDYSKSYPACSSSGPTYCTGPNGTPSYCNYAATSYGFTSTPTAGIYCAYGSGTPSNPATYTGAVSMNNGGYSVTGSFICGTFTVGSGISSLTAYNFPTNKLAIYAAATSGNAVSIGGGGFPITGDIFAPTATISINAGITGTNFLEGLYVSPNAGGYNVTGDGPSDTTTGSTSSISSLVQ